MKLVSSCRPCRGRERFPKVAPRGLSLSLSLSLPYGGNNAAACIRREGVEESSDLGYPDK